MGKDEPVPLRKKIRAAEKDFTKGLLRWRIKQGGLPPADEETLEVTSERIVDEAHAVIRRHGKSLFDDFKQAKEEFLKAYRSKDKK